MVKINIIIPCHIESIIRIDKFYKCLISLINQSEKCNIFISVSFISNQFKQLFNNVLENNNINENENVKIYFHDKVKSQFQHFKYLEDKLDCDYVMFCDNDDLYTNDRVKVFKNMIEKDELKHSVYIEKHNLFHVFYNEYPMHVVKKEVFSEFLSKSEMWHYHKYCDMLFSKYLQSYYYNDDSLVINQRMYIYVKKNDGSSITSYNRLKNNKNGTQVINGYDELQKYWNEQFISMKDNLFVIILLNSDLSFDNTLKEMMTHNYENNMNVMPTGIYHELYHDYQYKKEHLLSIFQT